MNLTDAEIQWIKDKYAAENKLNTGDQEKIKHVSEKYQDEKDSLMQDKGKNEDAKFRLKEIEKIWEEEEKIIEKGEEYELTDFSEEIENLNKIIEETQPSVDRFNEIMTLQDEEINNLS